MWGLRRWVVNGLIATTLVVYAGTIVAWVQSYFMADHWHSYRSQYISSQLFNQTQDFLDIYHGGISLKHATIIWPNNPTNATNTTQSSKQVSEWSWTRRHFTNDDVVFYPSARPSPPNGWLTKLGFDWFHGQKPAGASVETDWTIVFPFWLVSALMLMPVIYVLVLLRRQRRLDRREQLGLCTVCGYDLWGRPDRCPECGAAP